MVKSIRILVLVLVGTITGHCCFSQYYIKFKSDSLGLQADSVVLAVKSGTGDIEWEVSKDSVTWQALNESNDSLFIRIDSCAYYRAVLSDGTCYPLKSDVALVAFKSINVTGNTVVIDSIGGVYLMPSGIKLIVPPGAVNEKVSLSMDLLDMDHANLKIPLDIFAGKEFCVGLYCEPAIIHFQKPVRLVIPALNYKYTDLPYIYLYNPDSGLWDQYFGTLLCSEESHFIEFSAEDIYPARIELIPDAFGSTKSQDGKNGEPVCEKGLVEILSKAHDYIGTFASGTCHTATNSIQATFKDCKDRPVSTDYVQEISDKCIPTCTASIDRDCFYIIGAKATMTFKMEVGGLPLEQNTIMVLLPSGIVRDSEVGDPTICELTTDSKGEATLTVKSTLANVTGTIKWKATAHYFLRVQKVSNVAGTENNYEIEKTVQLPDATLEIKACPKLTLSIWWVERPAEYYHYIEQNNTYHVAAGCKDEHGWYSRVCPGPIRFFVDHTVPVGKDVVSVDEITGVVTPKSGGIAYIKAKVEGTDIVSGELVFSVAYQGTLNVDIIDADNHRCYCPYDPDPDNRHYYLMSFWGKLSFKFWLNQEEYQFDEENNKANLRYEEKVGYKSTSAYCKDSIWAEPQIYTVEWKFGDIVRAYVITETGFRLGTTDDVLAGTQFRLSFPDLLFWDYIHNSWFNCKLPDPMGDLDVVIDQFYPEGCLGFVHGSCKLH